MCVCVQHTCLTLSVYVRVCTMYVFKCVRACVPAYVCACVCKPPFEMQFQT